MEIDIKGLMLLIRRKIWWVLAIVTAASLTAGLISYYVLKPTYEASSQIIVNSTKGVGEGVISINEVNMDLRLIDTYKEIIKTTSMMKHVTMAYPNLGYSPAQLAAGVQVDSVNNTQVITISFQNENYAKAAKTVNAIAQVFRMEIPTLMKTDNVSILGLADELAKPAPIGPKTVFHVALTFMISLLVSIGCIVFLDYLDDTVKSEGEIYQMLGLPNLATIMVISESDYSGQLHTSIKGKGKLNDVTIGQEA
ncbi:Wzz/FepE/Etk N-terminal domain-containing protein [Paenibacillus sp. ACRRX]|uniref:YveK family protein n=1 Tax=unclassified Paenibacillus TaxID=185978 RepID=UPI001EF615CA|nr:MULTISPECIES: Wzz/FepE/Etk N-terminal domain-containing protein [unclassified Paenibacillus]MCG7406094.1 Wzz/FepE/Etk N-terminal domain-containing protein [Paenibacillus sp. ACRRX]MDK8182549.1 Wzz/FepE/Etk N-terminal domain-containing protein [Paenibacillus sp. UMB4589-SE434]